VRILFLLSCLEPSGSETYCLSLAKTWNGTHDIFWISDILHYGQRYTSMPIHMKAFPMGLVNTWRVASFIRENKIQLVHSHSRRSHWVAAQAARMTKIPHVTTIHQPLPVHFFSKTFPCLGDETIAIDEAVVDHLHTHFKRPLDKIHMVRNGIDLRTNLPTIRQAPAVKQILWVGRLSGGRWNVFLNFLEFLERHCALYPPAHYKIVGQIPYEKKHEVAQRLSQTSSRIAPSTIESLGHVKDLELLVRNSDGAIAAGRSALECMALGKPTILMGEGGILGLCKPALWPQALRSNMGDHIEPKNFDTAPLEQGLREMLGLRTEQQEVSRLSRVFVEQHYNLTAIAAQVEGVYRKALA
jgi:glycosyltransferase involved in cell wall biosynthesis